MKYISAEEFLRQDKEVQEVFQEWWKPSVGDLYTCDNNGILKFINEDVESELEFDKDFLKNTIHCFNSLADRIIPLLTEGQIRKFIEDKTECNKMTTDCHKDGYTFYLYNHDKQEDKIVLIGTYEISEDCDLLQAYWKIAIEIAKEEK